MKLTLYDLIPGDLVRVTHINIPYEFFAKVEEVTTSKIFFIIYTKDDNRYVGINLNTTTTYDVIERLDIDEIQFRLLVS